MTGRKKNRKNKPVKKNKKRATKKRVSSFTAKKKRGRDIYDITLKKGYKTKDELLEIIDNINTKFSDFPDDQVKITMYANKGDERGGMSYIYDLPDSGDKNENNQTFQTAMKEMIEDIFKAKPMHEAGYLKHAAIKNYITDIVIDFETNN